MSFGDFADLNGYGDESEGGVMFVGGGWESGVYSWETINRYRDNGYLIFFGMTALDMASSGAIPGTYVKPKGPVLKPSAASFIYKKSPTGGVRTYVMNKRVDSKPRRVAWFGMEKTEINGNINIWLKSKYTGKRIKVADGEMVFVNTINKLQKIKGVKATSFKAVWSKKLGSNLRQFNRNLKNNGGDVEQAAKDTWTGNMVGKHLKFTKVKKITGVENSDGTYQSIELRFSK
jgi:hypothetical protein